MAQHNVTFKVTDSESGSPLPGVNILLEGANVGAVTLQDGTAVVSNVPSGRLRFRISLVGYEQIVITLLVPNETADVIGVKLEHHHEELEEVTVYAARGSRLIDRVPTRAEVIAGEELEEKANMNSSNISMILRETPGLQVQMTDPSTANMSFRIQGLNGRYTQLLQDGLPMYGGISSSLSIVQIPPLNLKQVEIIKGSSSTLYGGGAIAGLVNLVTKTFEDEGTTIMFNGLSTMGGDVNIFSAGKAGEIGYTTYISGVTQKAYDVDNDGFVEVPKTGRIHLEPTLWLPVGTSNTLRTSIGYTRDVREGGFQNSDVLPDPGRFNYFKSKIETDRFKALVDLDIPEAFGGKIQFRNALSITQSKSNDNLNHRLRNDQTKYYAEANFATGGENVDLITGLTYSYDHTSSTYRDRDIIKGVSDGTAGVFGQYTFKPNKLLSIESGLRAESISGSSLIVLPRLNVLANWGPKLTSRVGFGTGYKHIDAMFGDVNDAIQQSNHMEMYTLHIPDGDAIERSLGFTADVDYRTILGDELGLSVNQLFFQTRITDPFQLFEVNFSQPLTMEVNEDPLPTIVLHVVNRSGDTQTRGMETNIKWTFRNLKWYQFYTYTNVTETASGTQFPVILTPKHRLGSVIMLEEHDSFRIGFETYVTGSQRLTSGEKSDPYVIMGLMAEKTWNMLSVFINFENFTDTRMKTTDKLWTGSPSHPTLNTELYAPIEGRVINGGVKLRF